MYNSTLGLLIENIFRKKWASLKHEKKIVGFEVFATNERHTTSNYSFKQLLIIANYKDDVRLWLLSPFRLFRAGRKIAILVWQIFYHILKIAAPTHNMYSAPNIDNPGRMIKYALGQV